MSNLFCIQEIKALTTSDKIPLYWLTGTPVDPFAIGTQPHIISILSAKDLSQNKKSDIIDLSDENTSPFWIFNKEKIDVLELLGSDHNSGIVWYGKTDDIGKLMIDVQHFSHNFIPTMGYDDVIDDYLDLLNSPLVQWNFDDNTSILIFYTDCDGFSLDTVPFDNNKIVSTVFGAYTDDIMLQEIVLPVIAKYLRHIKINDEIEKNYHHLDSYAEYITGKKPTQETIKLILNLSYHLYCSLLQWDTDETNEDKASLVVAKKLAHYFASPSS